MEVLGYCPICDYPLDNEEGISLCYHCGCDELQAEEVEDES